MTRPWFPIKDAPRDGTELELYWPELKHKNRTCPRIRGIGSYSSVNGSSQHFNLGKIHLGDDPTYFRYLDSDPT